MNEVREKTLSSEESDILQRSNKKFKRVDCEGLSTSSDVSMVPNSCENIGSLEQLCSYSQAARGFGGARNPLFEGEDGEDDIESEDDQGCEEEERDESQKGEERIDIPLNKGAESSNHSENYGAWMLVQKPGRKYVPKMKNVGNNIQSMQKTVGYNNQGMQKSLKLNTAGPSKVVQGDEPMVHQVKDSDAGRGSRFEILQVEDDVQMMVEELDPKVNPDPEPKRDKRKLQSVTEIERAVTKEADQACQLAEKIGISTTIVEENEEGARLEEQSGIDKENKGVTGSMDIIKEGGGTKGNIPMIVWAPTREKAIARMKRALDDTIITGVPTSIEYHKLILDIEDFKNGNVDTAFIPKHEQELAEV
ncbi:hypothetical protein BVRB_9g207660 [Beta vulgaris subsp. vulgaris]|nr:hypothetical protein BVRB_9g207660 [Beta vulgaris subsp. vulgaris]